MDAGDECSQGTGIRLSQALEGVYLSPEYGRSLWRVVSRGESHGLTPLLEGSLVAITSKTMGTQVQSRITSRRLSVIIQGREAGDSGLGGSGEMGRTG